MPVDGAMEFSFLGWGTRVFLAMTLIPYFGWGIYTLRLRYRYHEDLSIATEAITLVAVAVFYLIELLVMRPYINAMPVTFMFTILGLVASGAALYGPTAISLLSRVLVDFVMPPDASATHEPRYAPAEALERAMDYEGALREYMAIARVFPKHPATFARIGEMYVKLDAPQDAARWFEKALILHNEPEAGLHVVNRACELYQRQLSQPAEAARLLKLYLKKFPEGEFAQVVRNRIERLEAPPKSLQASG